MLIDSNIISATRRANRNSDIINWLDARRSGGVYLPAPVVTELSYGIALVKQLVARAMLEAWLSRVLGSEKTVAMDADAFELYGRMLASPPLAAFRMAQPGSKRPQLAADLQTAAIAIVRDEAVATLNGQDFARIQAAFPALRYLNPRTTAGGSEAA